MENLSRKLLSHDDNCCSVDPSSVPSFFDPSFLIHPFWLSDYLLHLSCLRSKLFEMRWSNCSEITDNKENDYPYALPLLTLYQLLTTEPYPFAYVPHQVPINQSPFDTPLNLYTYQNVKKFIYLFFFSILC
jgi:hypothetical protein